MWMTLNVILKKCFFFNSNVQKISMKKFSEYSCLFQYLKDINFALSSIKRKQDFGYNNPIQMKKGTKSVFRSRKMSTRNFELCPIESYRKRHITRKKCFLLNAISYKSTEYIKTEFLTHGFLKIRSLFMYVFHGLKLSSESLYGYFFILQKYFYYKLKD